MPSQSDHHHVGPWTSTGKGHACRKRGSPDATAERAGDAQREGLAGDMADDSNGVAIVCTTDQVESGQHPAVYVMVSFAVGDSLIGLATREPCLEHGGCPAARIRIGAPSAWPMPTAASCNSAANPIVSVSAMIAAVCPRRCARVDGAHAMAPRLTGGCLGLRARARGQWRMGRYVGDAVDDIARLPCRRHAQLVRRVPVDSTDQCDFKRSVGRPRILGMFA